MRLTTLEVFPDLLATEIRLSYGNFDCFGLVFVKLVKSFSRTRKNLSRLIVFNSVRNIGSYLTKIALKRICVMQIEITTNLKHRAFPADLYNPTNNVMAIAINSFTLAIYYVAERDLKQTLKKIRFMPLTSSLNVESKNSTWQ